MIQWAEEGKSPIIHLVGRTAADVRDVMIAGPAGILACSPPWFRPKYQPSKKLLEWPNGVIAKTYSAEEPETLRGPQCYKAWGDEVAAWRYPEAYDQLRFGLRLGDAPQAVFTTTPKPTPLIKKLMASPKNVLTRGTTYDNAANLSDDALDEFREKYEGTRLGRQELEGQILDDNPNALWQRGWLEKGRRTSHPDLVRCVVAVDPPSVDPEKVKKGQVEDVAECGIVVAGQCRDKKGWVIADKSIKGSPEKWAKAAVAAYHTHRADCIVAEMNNGGEMVRHTIHSIDPTVPVVLVWASRGKVTRAEPISALYEQFRIYHVGFFAELEDQMCEWEPGLKSPDRMDALVWALTHLFLGPKKGGHGVDY